MVRRTGAERLRRVTADDWPDAAERDEARAWVRSMSALPTWPVDAGPAPEPPPKPVPLAESLRARRLGFNNCWYAVKCNTGCQGPRCHHLKRIVSLRDCIDCLKP